jgi:hemerythrin-like domain-containing protein
MAGKRKGKERAVLLDRHKRMRKLCARLQDRLGMLSSDDRELDMLGEMTELLSLRMQHMMETRSKMLSTISNILKRMADTQDDIIRALK